MSILHVQQIQRKIEELFSVLVDNSDISRTDLARDKKILTRCLAAYAVYTTVDCSMKEAAAAVTDGADDNGIDAIFYSPIQNQLIIVQSKWMQSGSGEPDSAGVSKFCDGVKDLFNLAFDRFNYKVNNNRAAIERALGEYDTRYLLILADTGDRELSVHAQRRIDDLLKSGAPPFFLGIVGSVRSNRR
ncbi:hypothetical protein [Nitrosococcus wardiae]|uniref:hypothetical protein n=1 Tax=Nitrosococcus wardiae TaxID=1814290 RepID=UPI00197F0266|nr:hypothetical protein [Nitrosococcus wardiae]